MTNSKQKGKRGERAWRDELRAAGFVKAHRGQQYAGGTDSPDVICPELPDIHFEVKYTQKLSIYDAIYQARKDAGYKLPIVAYRKNNSEWLAIMSAESFFTLIKDAGYAVTVFCPSCKKSDVIKIGFDEKRKQKYRCKNNSCNRDNFIID